MFEMNDTTEPINRVQPISEARLISPVSNEGGEPSEYWNNGVFDFVRKYNYDKHDARVAEVPDDPSELDNILKELRENFFQTKQTFDIEFRKTQLRRFGEGLRKYQDEFAKALEFDVGKSAFDADSEITGSEWAIAHDISHVDDWAKDEAIDTPIMMAPGTCKVKPEPLGVVAVISAWNYPVLLMATPVTQAIITGNCVIAKPSELAPMTSAVMKKVFDEFLDPRFYRCVEGRLQVSIKLTSMRLDKIIFTGSTQTGRLVAQAAAKNLVPCILELGGKSPCVIDKTANIKITCNKILQARYANQGQTCIATDYVLVHDSLKDAFIAEMKSQICNGIKDGDTTQCAAVVSRNHYERICALLANHGGEVVHGNANAHKDMHLTSTVVLNPHDDCELMKEEIFGPILPVKTYTDFQEVIDYINRQEKPLVTYFFGDKDSKNCGRLMNETSSGSFTTNEVILQVINYNLPFGGVGESGMGRYHGKKGFEELSNMKSYLMRPILDYAPFNKMTFPYSEETKAQLTSPSMRPYVNSVTTRQLKSYAWRCGGICTLIVAAVLVVVYRDQIFGNSQDDITTSV